MCPPSIPVSTNSGSPNVPVNGQQQMMPQTNGQYDEDMGYRYVYLLMPVMSWEVFQLLRKYLVSAL